MSGFSRFKGIYWIFICESIIYELILIIKLILNLNGLQTTS